ncbi:hypothetical protein DPV78_005862 [Talaromyces pinophilus]|nr:hypothetical protein DPV78_005862 [Talaromyces pinophilus]
MDARAIQHFSTTSPHIVTTNHARFKTLIERFEARDTCGNGTQGLGYAHGDGYYPQADGRYRPND